FSKTKSLQRNLAKGRDLKDYTEFNELEKFVCEWASFELRLVSWISGRPKVAPVDATNWRRANVTVSFP
ncbi:MAG: hypothetical protein RBR38_07635, partial [Desulfomicrobium apsheronum]|nr:hypothetical protein [Desulfomicrobium apsheronum]